MPSTQLILTPQFEAAPIEGGPLDLLVRLKAPEALAPEAPRQRLRLAIVIDRSGSMSGHPLGEAIRCAQRIVLGLHQDDDVAVIVYDDHVDVAIPMQSSSSARRLAAALTDTESGGSTALYDGWRCGLAQLGDPESGVMSRVILLSDGQANVGPQTLAEFEPEAQAAAARGLTTTTVGLGRGFNEELMIGLARAGGGQHYYGETANDLFDAFDEEFALLQSLCARNLRLYFTGGAGTQVEVVSQVSAQGPGWFALSDLAYGAEAWALLKLHLAPAAGAETDRPHLLTVRVEGEAFGDAVLDTIPGRLDLPCLPLAMVVRGPENDLVRQRRAEVLFAATLRAVRDAMQRGDRDGEAAAIEQARQHSAGQPWLEQKLQHMLGLLERDREMYRKEALYASRKLNTRLSDSSEVRYLVDETQSADRPAYLRRKVGEGRGRREV